LAYRRGRPKFFGKNKPVLSIVGDLCVCPGTVNQPLQTHRVCPWGDENVRNCALEDDSVFVPHQLECPILLAILRIGTKTGSVTRSLFRAIFITLGSTLRYLHMSGAAKRRKAVAPLVRAERVNQRNTSAEGAALSRVEI